MRYFANPSTERIRAVMSAGLIDCIDTPKQRSRMPVGVTWCADNGCGPGRGGKIGAGFPGEAAWWQWLSDRDDLDRCAFAVAPDVVGDAVATLERSAPWLPKIRSLGVPAALVAQDGLEDLVVPWDDFDVLFIGGSTDWKLGAAARELVREAKRRGKWVHFGRVNSQRRYAYAAALGCDSADGTVLTFGPDTNLRRVRAWVATATQQHVDLQEIGA